MRIIDRPKLVQVAIRKTWSPSIVRHRFILPNERAMFNKMHASSPVSKYHQFDKLVSGSNWVLASNWVKHRFTCLGKDWDVGTILIKERAAGQKTWWFTAASLGTPNGDYNPNLILYKHIIIPLQVNCGENIDHFSKITYYTTNYHYTKNNSCLFKISGDYYQTSKSNYPLNYNLEALEKTDNNISGQAWYKKYEFSKYSKYIDESDRSYLIENNWDIELPFTCVPGSVLITDATRVYGYKTGIDSIYQRRILSIMTYKVR